MSAAERKLRGMKNRKRSILSSFAAISSFLDNFEAERDTLEIPVRLENLIQLWTDYNKVQTELETLEEDEDLIDSYLKERTEFESSYYRIKGTLLMHNKPYNTTEGHGRLQDIPSQMTHVKLPDVKLPVFSGEFEQWLNFHDLFVSLVHSAQNLSTIQKFYYLRSSLAGEALKLIQTIPISNDQYHVAWQMLVDHFQNERRLKRTYVQSLFDFPYIKRESAPELHNLIEKFQANVKVLKQLGEQTEHWDVLLIHLLSTRLDAVTRRDWEEFAESNKVTKFSQLIEFLQRRVNVLQTVVNKPIENPHSTFNNKKPNLMRTGNLGAVQNSLRNCLACHGQHNLYQCSTFPKMSFDEKERLLRRYQLCRNCLRKGHWIKDCPSESSCRRCRNRHHTLLCTNDQMNSNNGQLSSSSHNRMVRSTNTNSNTAVISSVPISHTGVTSCVSREKTRSQVLLATAIVILEDESGINHTVRALLDSGSECCFATERIRQQMKVRQHRVNLPIAGIGQAETQVRYAFQSTLKSRISNYSTVIDLYVLPKVTVDLPSISVDASRWAIPQGIQLADPAFYESCEIDIVIGAEVFFEIFDTKGHITLGESLPCLTNSLLGWVVSGKTSLVQNPRNVSTCNVATTLDIHRSMERFWTIEDDSSPAYSPEESSCEKQFSETIARNPDGRYVVRLPLKQEMLHKLDDNHRTALHRFRLLETRLKRNPVLADEYRAFMDEYIALGHMEQIDDSQSASKPSFLLPHHPVVRENSSTTKVRVVFDASCKGATGLSLNEMMLVGPVIQEELRSIILRARLHPVMLIADIAKMFRQIWVHHEDTPLQRIFWRPSSANSVQIYELKTITYGTAAAPYLATRVLKQLADDERENFPLAAKSTCEDFYVDDYITGTNTVDEAIELREQMQAMFATAGMQLRKWASNFPAALEGLSEANCALQTSLEFDKNQSIKTLGLHWEPHTDYLKYVIPDIPFDSTTPLTKRNILSCIAKLFDPLGLVGPVVVTAKIIMQALWGLKNESGKTLDWDREVPDTIKIRWTSYHTQLSQLNNLRIERLIVLPNATTTQLHFFSDASEAAYGSCVYVRTLNSSGNVKVILLTSRSKVAPLKLQSIPRLELCGALLSAEMYTKVKTSLKINVNAYFWVDSTAVLCYLKATPSTWTTFVANRVSKIQHATESCEWNFVAGHNNPADIISRGISPSKLLNNKLWWEGPSWLQQPKDSWPTVVPDLEPSSDISKEMRKTVFVSVTSTSTALSFIEEYTARFSSYQKMLRVLAYGQRFIKNISVPKTKRESSIILTTNELRDAELVIIRLVQQECFPEEWRQLQRKQMVSAKSRLRWFNPQIFHDNVIRIGGRLGRSAQCFDSQHQILLPRSHTFTTLLVRCLHERLLHAAVQLLTNTIRLRFWILGGRSVARNIVHSCVICFRAKPKLVQQFMSELPSQRVTASRPFSTVGVDFWGPIYIKPRYRRDAPPKAYVAVFVCFSTKAVHLELVVDLTTAKFLQAFRRFVSHRGLCSDVYSDNGKNFIGAANELRRLMRSDDFKHAIATESAEIGIRWHFNPPKGSHFGGLWEAAIGSAQKHFIRVLDDRKLAFDDMETLLTQIECCLNSRPLTKLTDDPTDLQALTPGHFLVGTALNSVPDTNFENIPFNRLLQWQQTQKIFQDIWKRWHMEYLSSLQPRTKWCNTPKEFQKDQLVIILDENQPPMRWPMARINELHAGKDGVVRVVTLQKGNALFTRPVSKICLLPIPPEKSTSLIETTSP